MYSLCNGVIARLQAEQQSEHIHTLYQVDALQTGYGFLKWVKDPSAKFENTLHSARAILERRDVSSDRRYQKCTDGLVCKKVKLQSSMYIDNSMA